MRRLGLHTKLGGAQPGQLAPAAQRDVPCHVVSCSATKTRGKFSRTAVAQGLAEHRSPGGEPGGFFTPRVFLGFVLFLLT